MRVFLVVLGLIPYCFSQAVLNNVRDKTKTPLVINTWAFSSATEAAWRALKSGKSALDALEIGCSTCEELQCDGTVGFGGSPDENGETTLDAMVFNGDTMEMGSVAGLRRIKKAASVARKVMEHTGHSILAGDLAAAFAKQMGFKEESLSTNVSTSMWKKWKQSNCQPNFWKNCSPDPLNKCGPYKPVNFSKNMDAKKQMEFGRFNHDTISMIIIDSKGSVVAGTSSNGAKFKIPGYHSSYSAEAIGLTLGLRYAIQLKRSSPQIKQLLFRRLHELNQFSQSWWTQTSSNPNICSYFGDPEPLSK